jgi:hypothetical protein
MPPNVRTPSRNSRQFPCPRLIIVLLLWQSALAHESIPPATAPKKENAWAQGVKKHLDAIDARVARLSNLQLQQTQLGPLPSDPRKRREHDLKSTELHFEIMDESIHLRLDIYALWFMTGHGEIIVKFEPRDIDAKGAEISKQYRTWLQQHENESLEPVLRKSMLANIAALKTKYCCVALDVINTWNDLPSHSSVTHFEHDFLLVTEASQKSIEESMTQWYEKSKNRLVWNEKRQQFTDEGRMFLIADYTFEPDLRATMIEYLGGE